MFSGAAVRSVWLAASLLVLTVGVPPASAHSGLLVAVPAPGDEVGGEFDLQLYFGEAVESVIVEVLDPGGVDIVVGQEEPVVGLIEVEVSPMTTDGVYVVTYDVRYTDGAQFDSIYQFTYSADAAAPLPLEFDDVESDSSLLSTIALWVLIGASTILVLLLAWRLRQTQAGRVADEVDGEGEAASDGTTRGVG